MEKKYNKARTNGIYRLLKSIKHALDGLRYAARNEKNFQIEILFAAAVIALTYILEVSRTGTIAIWMMVFAVLIMELLNTILERLVNILIPKVHPYAKVIKDMMAAVVLLTAIGAAIIGMVIFYPYIKDIFINSSLGL
jgi:diacylglycerol kinase